MLIHLPTLKTLGFCCGTRANRLLSHPDNTPVVRTSNAKPSGCPGDFVTKRRRRAVLHSRAGLLRQKTRYRRNRLLPQGNPAAHFGNATSGRANGNARRPPRSIDNFGGKARER